MAHRSRLAGFIIDCQTDDLESATDFWSNALGLPRAPAHPDNLGLYIRLNDTPGDLHVEVLKVTHSSRVHLDIETDDIEAEVGRLEKLGARHIGTVKRWCVMEAPTGQRFCVVKMHHPERGAPPTEWP